jgi:EpsI family protein
MTKRRFLPTPSRRDFVFGGATLAAAGVAYARMPRVADMSIGKDQLDKVVPLTIGNWRYASASGLVLPPPDQLEQLLYDQQVTREYEASDSLPVMLLMAYGSSQSGMMQVHRPEICYPSGGFKLSRTEFLQMPAGGGDTIPCRFFTATSDTRVEHVLYWTRIGPMLPTSWTQQRIAVMRSNLSGRIPDGLLVRVSTVTQDRDQALAVLQKFTPEMLTAAGARGRRLLIGRA